MCDKSVQEESEFADSLSSAVFDFSLVVLVSLSQGTTSGYKITMGYTHYWYKNIEATYEVFKEKYAELLPIVKKIVSLAGA